MKMIYQCYKCNRFVNEEDGAVVFIKDTVMTIPPQIMRLMAFKCKHCFGKCWQKVEKEIKDKK